MSGKSRMTDIKRRIATLSVVKAWREHPLKHRDGVIEEIDTAAEELSETDPGLYHALRTASGLLDCLQVDGAGEVWNKAIEDLEWLVAEVDRLTERMHRHEWKK